MAALEIHDAYGRIDLSKISEDAAAALTQDQQEILSLVIDATKAREIAEARKAAALKRVRECMVAETAAIEANQRANPPPSRIEAMRAAQTAFNKSNQ